VLSLSLALACGGGRPAAVAPGPSAALQAPVEFEFESLDDRPINAKSTRGKPTLVTFVTTSSLSAQAQVDFLVAMAKHDADKVNYAVVALEQPEHRELVALYKKALSVTFPVAIADARTLVGGGPFGDVSAVPVTAVLDRLGRIVWRVDGRVAKSSELREALRGL
jgi:hypothetical protein